MGSVWDALGALVPLRSAVVCPVPGDLRLRMVRMLAVRARGKKRVGEVRSCLCLPPYF